MHGKMAVKKLMSILAKESLKPYGPDLFLDTEKVIKEIESLPLRGNTMLYYFVYVVRFLKEMAKAGIPGAKKAANVMQQYKSLNYQHFKRMPSEGKRLSQARNVFVNTHKELFENNIVQVNCDLKLLRQMLCDQTFSLVSLN